MFQKQHFNTPIVGMNCTGGQYYNDCTTYNIMPSQHNKCSPDNLASASTSSNHSDNFSIPSYVTQQQVISSSTTPLNSTNCNVVKGGEYCLPMNMGPQNFTINQCPPTDNTLSPHNNKHFQSPVHYSSPTSFGNYDQHPVPMNMPPPLTILRRGNSVNSSPPYQQCHTPPTPIFSAPTHDMCYQRFYSCYPNSRYVPSNCTGNGFMYNCNQDYCSVMNQPSHYNGINTRDEIKLTNNAHLGSSTLNIGNTDENKLPGNNFTELIITNLDYNIGPKEWKKILYTQLQGALKNVQQVYMQTQADGSNCAIVRVGSIEDARLAISQFHRKKIGYKRIQVNIVSPENSWNAQTVKHEVVALLKSVSGRALSVCKFMELFEKRYHRSVSISELYKLKDVVEIKDYGGNQNGRIIFLLSNAAGSLSQNVDTTETDNLLESSVCVIHCQEGSKEYIDAMDSCILPNVEIKLKTFKHQVHKLLQMHNGSMPLMSFPACYKAEFGELIVARNQGNSGAGGGSCASGDAMLGPSDSSSGGSGNGVGGGSGNSSVVILSTGSGGVNSQASCGVPLEHLITCVTGVHITVSPVGVKKIQWEEKRDESRLHPSQSRLEMTGPTWASPQTTGMAAGVLADQLHQLSREVVDLIKHQPGCRILLSRFIPTYHHHFGKQCRVADYGYSKLHELIEALPHVVHLMGSGNLRTLTLAHRVQVRRFTNELTKILKAQLSKSCRASDLPATYQRIFKRDFHVTDYGVCYLEDLLTEIPENTVEVTMEPADAGLVVSVPRRLQTPDEKEKTAQFALEVVDLLQQSPRCRLPFNKFIPSYHHHFSRQCKVADYGFGKLVELLEAVPHVAQIVEEHDEKYVCLTRREQLRVLAEQTLSLLEGSPNKRIPLRDFINVYMKHQGYALNLDDFAVRNVRQLMEKIPRIARVESSKTLSIEGSQLEEYVCLAERTHIKHLAHKVLLLLLDQPCGAVTEAQFVSRYQCHYGDAPNMHHVTQELSEIIKLVEDPTCSGSYLIELRPLILFARDLKQLLRDNQGRLQMPQLEVSYERQFRIPLRPQAYGYPSIMTLLQAVNYVASVRGRGPRATVLLCHDFLGKLSYRVAYSTEPSETSNDLLYDSPSQQQHNHQQQSQQTQQQQSQKSQQQLAGPSSVCNNLSQGPPLGLYGSPPLELTTSHVSGGNDQSRNGGGFLISPPGSVYPSFYSGYPSDAFPEHHHQNELDELVEQLAHDASITGVSNTPSPPNTSSYMPAPPPGFYMSQWANYSTTPTVTVASSMGHKSDSGPDHITTTSGINELKDLPDSVVQTANSRLVGQFDCLRSN